MIIIGSAAVKLWIRDFREPNDTDIVCLEDELEAGTINLKGKDWIILPQEILDLIPEDNGYATLDAVYTLKCSHLGWDIKWQKHKSDVLYLKAKGCKKLPELYSKLTEYWRKENGNKPFLSLYKKKDDFFNEYVPYVYDHDYLHELVAYPNPPAYSYCLCEGADVAIDKDKFDKLSLDQQLRMFKEEISVIAAERWLIPEKICGKYTWMQAYHLALHKTVVSLTKNWATDFLIDHLDYFVRPEFSYFYHLFNTIKEGKIIMAQKVSNWKEIVAEVIEAYNAEYEEDWDIEDEGYSEFVYLYSFGEFENIEQEGGGEGGGEYCFFVFKWKDVYYKLEYSYRSYDGYDFDDAEMYIVTPTEKTVTVYE